MPERFFSSFLARLFKKNSFSRSLRSRPSAPRFAPACLTVLSSMLLHVVQPAFPVHIHSAREIEERGKVGNLILRMTGQHTDASHVGRITNGKVHLEGRYNKGSKVRRLTCNERRG